MKTNTNLTDDIERVYRPGLRVSQQKRQEIKTLEVSNNQDKT